MSADLKLAFAGDLLLGGEWPKYAQQRGVDLLAPFEKIIRVVEDADLFFVNLEGPISGTLLTGKGSRSAKLANHPDVVGFLKRARTCVCVLANNHITDAGGEGIARTRELLESEGIHCVGAGRDVVDAERPVVVECKGKRIGCLAFASDDRNVSATIATNEAGCAGLNDISKVEGAIKALKQKCDVVVVSVHWGIEFFQYPTSEQVAIVGRLVDAGADYLMGHHPHVLQGIEKRGRSLAMYSLGHFFVPPFRRADGELIRPKNEAREFAVVTSDVGDRSFEVFGGRMSNEFLLEPYDAAGQTALRRTMEGWAPSRIANYDEFIASYREARGKELQRERKLEALSGLVREPIAEIKRRIGSRASAHSEVSA